MGRSPTAAQNRERLGLLTMLMKLNDLDSFPLLKRIFESGVGRENNRAGGVCDSTCWYILLRLLARLVVLSIPVLFSSHGKSHDTES